MAVATLVVHPSRSALDDVTQNSNEGQPKQKSSKDVSQKLSETALKVFYKYPCLYSHKVFKNVGKIFGALRRRTEEDESEELSDSQRQQGLTQSQTRTTTVFSIHELSCDTDEDKRQCFNLAFEVLKLPDYVSIKNKEGESINKAQLETPIDDLTICISNALRKLWNFNHLVPNQIILENLLSEAAFFYKYPEFDQDKEVVCVMLFDFINRKFQPRTPLSGEVPEEFLSNIEVAILACRVKLDAMLARNRIKAGAPTLSHMLPENIRFKKGSCDMRQFVWVNRIKAVKQDVIDQFIDEGFKLVTSQDELFGKTFYSDTSCDNLLAFPPTCKEWLQQHRLIANGSIVLQDRSSCLGPHCTRTLLRGKNSCIITDVGSGKVAMHMCSLLWDEDFDYIGLVYCFGVKSAQHRHQLNRMADQLGVKNIRLIDGDFLDSNPVMPTFKMVKAILVTPSCSKTGVNNPVDFMVNEGEDISILADLSSGEIDEGKLAALVSRQNNTLRHAMKFADIQAIVYTTLSVNEAENEHVVERAVEYVNTLTRRLDKRAMMWEINPPTVEMTIHDIIASPNEGVVQDYLKYPPSEESSGCFVATITREKNAPLQTTKDILARAAKTGLLDKIMGGVPSGSEVDSERRHSIKKRKRRPKTADVPRRRKSLSKHRRALSAIDASRRTSFSRQQRSASTQNMSKKKLKSKRPRSSVTGSQGVTTKLSIQSDMPRRKPKKSKRSSVASTPAPIKHKTSLQHSARPKFPPQPVDPYTAKMAAKIPKSTAHFLSHTHQHHHPARKPRRVLVDAYTAKLTAKLPKVTVHFLSHMHSHSKVHY